MQEGGRPIDRYHRQSEQEKGCERADADGRAFKQERFAKGSCKINKKSLLDQRFGGEKRGERGDGDFRERALRLAR